EEATANEGQEEQGAGNAQLRRHLYVAAVRRAPAAALPQLLLSDEGRNRSLGSWKIVRAYAEDRVQYHVTQTALPGLHATGIFRFVIVFLWTDDRIHLLPIRHARGHEYADDERGRAEDSRGLAQRIEPEEDEQCDDDEG